MPTNPFPTSYFPLVSAAIIFLNEERFLSEAIDSVLAQTYDRWELLLIDDGSTDSSDRIARRYAERYPNRIRYLTHDPTSQKAQNRGMSASRNLGIAQAKGTYIAYLDGDDVWVPHKLTEQVDLALAHPEVAMVYGPLLDWYSWAEGGGPDGLYGVGKRGTHPYWNSLVEPPHLLRLFLQDEDYIPSGGLIRRDALLAQKGGTLAAEGSYEASFRGGYSDSVAFVKLCLSYPVWVSSRCWYQYRQHPNSSTAVSVLKGEDFLEERIYLTWVQRYFTAQGVTNRLLWQALNRSLWPHRHPQLYQCKVRYRHFVQQLEAIAVVVGRKLLPPFLRHWLWSQVKGSPAQVDSPIYTPSPDSRP